MSESKSKKITWFTYCSMCTLVVGCVLSTVSAEEASLSGSWWRQPAVPGRYTSLVARFDDPASNDADLARGNPAAGGFGMLADVPGKFGKATRIVEPGGHLHFLGERNFNPQRGTLRLLVKGDLWQDETPRWLFEARGANRIGIRRDKTALSLVVSRGTSVKEPIAQLDLPVHDVTPDEWHSVIASWDRASGTGAIALDGRCARGKIQFPDMRGPILVLYVGGGFAARSGGMNEPGMEIDELVIYDQTLDLLQTKKQTLSESDEKLLAAAEHSARKNLFLLTDLQNRGGWQPVYTWPTLIGASAQDRRFVGHPYAISNDKSYASPFIAIRFLYAYEVLGDGAFLEAAVRTADLLLAVQDPRGFWIHGYQVTATSVRPAPGSESYAKLQDSVQSHPIFLLACLHRLTGDDRYMAALKRAGDFYLKAQNPNGSWSHHFDAVKGIGYTARGLPQGGEINDLTMNDAIDVMILMYHITGERQYVEAIRRAGEWLISAQLRGATRGWAQQYDKDNNPVQARHFEPPSCVHPATTDACRALVEAYRLSHDQRYLQPIRDCLRWTEEAFPDGRMWAFHDLKTNRGIVQWEYKIYHLDDEAEAAQIRKLPRGKGALQKREITSVLRRLLQNADAPSDLIPEVTSRYVLQRLATSRDGAKQAVASQNDAGVWVEPVIAAYMGSLGAGFRSASLEQLQLLRYIEAARMAKGDLPAEYRGNGQILRMAYPVDDWYQVEWP